MGIPVYPGMPLFSTPMVRILTFLLCCISGSVAAQNWQQVGNLNRFGPDVMYVDSLTGLMFASLHSRFNGADTINGIFTFDGSTIKSLAKDRNCGNVDCGPALFLTRYGDDIYYSGTGLLRIDSIPLNGIGRWDGEEWHAGLPGLGGNDFDYNPYIDGHCIHDGKLYVSGQFRTADGDTCNSVAHWDGVQWTGLNFPTHGWVPGVPRVHHVFFYKGVLHAAGNFYVFLDGEWVSDIVWYDGANWHALGGGLKGGGADVWDWAIYKDELYVCGYFRAIDGNAGNKIMRWDGQQWKDVGGGLCYPFETARGMRVHDGRLLVHGIFHCVGNGIPASCIAAWDGERWCSFGNSVFDNAISELAVYKGDIYIGGGFTEVDGQPLKFFAKWVGDLSTSTCSEPVSTQPEPTTLSLKLWPNPTSDMLHLDAPGTIESLRVYDALGRDMGHCTSLSEEATLDVSQLPPGWYLLSAVLSDGRMLVSGFVKH